MAAQDDTILSCIDDPDFSIRLEALKLLSGLIDAHNITDVVNRLMRQLGSKGSAAKSASSGQIAPTTIEEPENEDVEGLSLAGTDSAHCIDHPMPDDYRAIVIRQILQMCSKDGYANITDFQWYLQVLIELCQQVSLDSLALASYDTTGLVHSDENIAALVGSELRNIAVRVTNVRGDVVRASSAVLAVQARQPSLSQKGSHEVLMYIIWVVGEYAELLPNITDTLDTLLLLCKTDESLTSVALQSAPKLAVAHVNSIASVWNGQYRALTNLLLIKIVKFCEQFVTSPNIETQERAIELLEVFRLAEEAIKGDVLGQTSPAFLLTHAIPSLFKSSSLNPVAPSAQRKVPIPKCLNLDTPINYSLNRLIADAEYEPLILDDLPGLESYYHDSSGTEVMTEGVGDTLDSVTKPINDLSGRDFGQTGDVLSKSQEVNYERHHDGPYYISNATDIATSAPAYFHDMVANDREHEIDIDAIPIMDLDLRPLPLAQSETKARSQEQRQNLHITADEEIETESDILDGHPSTDVWRRQPIARTSRSKAKRSVLQVDTSNVGGFDSGVDFPIVNVANVSYDYEIENEAMTKALAEVEQARLEMQRAAERVRTSGDLPDNGMLVKKRTKKQNRKNSMQGPHGSDANAPVIKKKRKTTDPASINEPNNTSNS